MFPYLVYLMIRNCSEECDKCIIDYSYTLVGHVLTFTLESSNSREKLYVAFEKFYYLSNIVTTTNPKPNTYSRDSEVVS